METFLILVFAMFVAVFLTLVLVKECGRYVTIKEWQLLCVLAAFVCLIVAAAVWPFLQSSHP